VWANQGSGGIAELAGGKNTLVANCRPAARAGSRPPGRHGGWWPQPGSGCPTDRTTLIGQGQAHQGTGSPATRQIPAGTGPPERRRFGLPGNLLVHEVAKAALVPPRVRCPSAGWGCAAPLTGLVVELDAQRRQQSPTSGRPPSAGSVRVEAGQGGGLSLREELPFTQTRSAQTVPRRRATRQDTRAFGPDHSQGVGPLGGKHVLHRA